MNALISIAHRFHMLLPWQQNILGNELSKSTVLCTSSSVAVAVLAALTVLSWT